MTKTQSYYGMELRMVVKSFMVYITRFIVIELLFFVGQNKLECLSPPIFQAILILRLSPGAYATRGAL